MYALNLTPPAEPYPLQVSREPSLGPLFESLTAADWHPHAFDRSHAPAWERKLGRSSVPSSYNHGLRDAGASRDAFPRWSAGTIKTCWNKNHLRKKET